MGEEERDRHGIVESDMLGFDTIRNSPTQDSGSDAQSAVSNPTEKEKVAKPQARKVSKPKDKENGREMEVDGEGGKGESAKKKKGKTGGKLSSNTNDARPGPPAASSVPPASPSPLPDASRPPTPAPSAPPSQPPSPVPSRPPSPLPPSSPPLDSSLPLSSPVSSPQSQPADLDAADPDVEMENEAGDDVTVAVTDSDRQTRNSRKRSRNGSTGDDEAISDELQGRQVDEPDVQDIHADEVHPPAAKRPRKSKKPADKVPAKPRPSSAGTRKKRAGTKAVEAPNTSYTDLPDDAPAWLKKKIWPFFTRSEGMPSSYKNLVNAWLDLEVADDFSGEDHLGGTGRPKAVTEWIATARRPTSDTRHVGSLVTYEADFWTWWVGVQHEYRKEHRRDDEVESLMQVAPPSTIPNPWRAIDTTGLNGLTNAVAAICFWAMKIHEQPATDYRSKQTRTKLEERWALAVADIHFVIDNVRALYD
jgi:hypothetical protein